MPSSRDRFHLIATPGRDRRAIFLRDVRAGLEARPRHLSCCYFYDREGSLLFEAICDLPEYYLTRAEREILQAHAGEIAGLFPRGATLIELGSGNAAKTRLLIEAFLRRQDELLYVPIDICRAMLEESAIGLLHDYAGLRIQAVAAEYQEALALLQDDGQLPRLILWLGSNIGNLDRAEAADFLARIRATMSNHDRLLIGIDLRKDRAILEPAYDDAQGVTAEFNLNLLARINRELAAHFDVGSFNHRAIYNEEQGRIEMYLVSNRSQEVRIEDLQLGVTLEEGEAIHTENSYKYSLEEIHQVAGAAGLMLEKQWFDGQGWFSVNLLRMKLD